MIRIKIVVFFILCLLAFVVPMLLLSGFWAAIAMRHLGYFFIAGCFGIFLILALGHPAVWNFLRGWGRGHRWGILLVLVAGCFLHVHEPHVFFVEYDESVLAGTSKLLHEDRQAAIPTIAHYVNGRLIHQGRYVDKRPIFFPFLVSVVHDLTGYRPENSFVINALAGFLLLGAIYALLARWFGVRYGYLGVLLMLTLPLLAQNATGGGFDLLNAAILVLVLNLGMAFVQKPGNRSMALFVFGMLLLAQSRYESIFFLIPGAFVIVTVWFREKRIWMPWKVALSPFFLISPMLSIRVFTSFEQFYQLEDRADSFFALGNLPENLEEAIFYFFQLDRDATNSPLLSLFGMICLVFCLMVLVRRGRRLFTEPDNLTVFFPFLGMVLFNVVWALTNFWGQFTDPVVSRVTFPFHAYATFSICLTAREFFKQRGLPVWIPVAVVAWVAGYTLPSYSRAYLTQDHVISRSVEMGTQFAEKEGTARDLFISTSSVPYIVHQRAAIPARRAVYHAARVIRSQELGFYDNVYVIMDFKADINGVFHPMEDEALMDIFEMELLREERFRPHVSSRIYRIEGLKAGVDAWEDLERLRNRPIPELKDLDIAFSLHRIEQLP